MKRYPLFCKILNTKGTNLYNDVNNIASNYFAFVMDLFKASSSIKNSRHLWTQIQNSSQN